MPYTLHYEEAGYIRLVYEGEAKIEDLKEVLASGSVLAQKHNCFHLLSDFRAIKLHLSLTSLFSIAEMQKALSNELNMPYYKFRRVVVVPRKDYSMFKFFEDVAVNRMHTIKVFIDYEAALQWLFAD